MEIQLNQIPNTSPSSSTSDPNPNPSNSMQSWWESISKARTRIHILSNLLPSSSISSLADSDRPARSLLESQESYLALSTALSHPNSGSGDDPLCQWLYETFQSSDPELRLITISFVPLLSGLYLSRLISNSTPSLAGFEAVMLALYTSETKYRAGKPLLISLPDPSQPSIYNFPRNKPSPKDSSLNSSRVLCPPLEPQNAVKSTKRALIISVALDCYYKQISHMPYWSKLDLCHFVVAWAGQNCPCRNEFDINADANGGGHRNVCKIRDSGDENEIEEVEEEMKKLALVGENSRETGATDNGDSRGGKIPLPWELLQPVLRILGHCLLAPLNTQDVKDAAGLAVRCLYARASHELMPQAILATRSLIQLDNRARAASRAPADVNAASNVNTPSKKKPEILLASK